jgi:protein involved in polysaccharide export with SLBB domain
MKKFIWFACVVLFSPSLFGQFLSKDLANIRVEQLTDEQLRQYKTQIANAKMSETEATELAKRKGMSDEQAQKLKTRLSEINGPEVAETNEDPKKRQDTSGTKDRVIEQLPSAKLEKVFGADIFTSNNMSFAPNIRVATPKNYVLGPDDKLEVMVYGYQEVNWTLTVTKEGFVRLPMVGVVNVSGKSIEAVSGLIRSKLIANGYASIQTGESKFGLYLQDIRSIHVTMLGVKRPGNYLLPSLVTLFHALYAGGGPADNGTYRNIQVIRGGKIIKTIDLYDFMLRGDDKGDISMQDDDIIFIPYYTNRVSIQGQVMRPGLFELKPKDNLDSLLFFAGGMNALAFKDHVYIEKIGRNSLFVKDVFRDSFGLYYPENGDKVQVGAIVNRFLNRVTIGGGVMRPGKYEVQGDMHLKELIEHAGGLMEDVVLQRGVIVREDFDRKFSYLHFDVGQALSGSVEHNLLLQNRDSVIILDNRIFDYRPVIRVLGDVRNPRSFRYSQGMTLGDALFLAGGFNRTAIRSYVEVIRPLRGRDTTSMVYRAVVDDSLNIMDGEFGLEAEDLVVVRPDPLFRPVESVIVDGEFNFPGIYSLPNRSTRVSDLNQMAGGLTKFANQEAIFLMRIPKDGIREMALRKAIKKVNDMGDGDSSFLDPGFNINPDTILGLIPLNFAAIQRNPGGSADLIMEPGDRIIAEKKRDVVTVNGRVFNAGVFPYERFADVRYYVESSGGFMDDADKKELFVIYSNGRAKTTKNFIFFKVYPKIKRDCIVMVPGYKRRVNQKESDVVASMAKVSIVSSMMGFFWTIFVK